MQFFADALSRVRPSATIAITVKARVELTWFRGSDGLGSQFSRVIFVS